MAELVLAACADDQGLLASDLRSGALVATFEESTPQPNAFGTVGGSSGHLFAAQAKKALWHVWGWGDRKPCYRAAFPERMTAMTFSEDGVFCFGGSATGSIWVWQTSTGTLLRSWPAHFREVTQLVVSQDGTFLISASADANVHVFNLADVFSEQTPKPFHSWAGHALAVTSIVLLPGSGLQRTVASASLDRSVRLWDVGTGRPITSRTLAAPVHCISTGPSGAEILCACGNGELRGFSPTCSPDEGAGPYTGHTGPVLSCALSADSTTAASCTAADRVRIWETRTRQCVSQLHTARNVQVSAVQIVQRCAHAPGLPPFQALQRVLTPPEDVPQVPLCMAGRASALKLAMEEHSGSREFLDKLLWGTGGSAEGAEDLRKQLAEAQALQARWADAAVELYDVLLDAGELEEVHADLGPLAGREAGQPEGAAAREGGEARAAAAAAAAPGPPSATAQASTAAPAVPSSTAAAASDAAPPEAASAAGAAAGGAGPRAGEAADGDEQAAAAEGEEGAEAAEAASQRPKKRRRPRR